MHKKLALVYLGDTHGAIDGEKITGLGGFARIVSAVKDYKAKNPGALFLFGGDLLGQTVFSTQFKGQVDAEVLNLMGVDAFAVGNHDFNNKAEGLRRVIDWMPKVPFVSANISVAEDPSLKEKVKDYVMLNVDGRQIAVIGALTEESKKLGDKMGGVVFKDLIESLKHSIIGAEMVDGADHIIILSHLGFEKDKEIAAELLKYSDLIILGNHTHTALGNLPEEKFGPSKGNYPLEISAHGHRAFITAASYHGQALGTLEIVFNQKNILFCYGKPLVIDDSFQPDAQALKIIEAYRQQMDPNLFKELAYTEVDLIGLDSFPYAKDLEDFIRREESPITNLVADAVFHAGKKAVPELDLALIHAGGIRSDWKKGTLSGENIFFMLPFDHEVITLSLTGKEIKQALEESVCNENYHRRTEFLIGSAGFSYHYDMAQALNSRVQKIQLHGKDLQDEVRYSVAINSFMLKNMNVFKNAYQQLPDDKKKHLGSNDRQALIDYTQQRNLVIDGHLEGRVFCAQGSLLDNYAGTDVALAYKYIVALEVLSHKSFEPSANVAVMM